MVGKNKKTEIQAESVEQPKQVEKTKKADKKAHKETKTRENKKRKANKNGKSLAEKKYNVKISDLRKRYAEVKFPNEIKDIISEYTEIAERVKKLRPKIVLLRQHYLHDTSKIEKTKRIKKANRSGNGGFKGKHVIPTDLAEWLEYGTDEKVELTIPELTKRFWEIIRKKGQTWKDDGRVFRPDGKLKKIFNLPDSVDTSTNFNDRAGFNFTTLQRHFSQKFKEIEGTAGKDGKEQPKEDKTRKETSDKKSKKQKIPQPADEHDDEEDDASTEED